MTTPPNKEEHVDVGGLLKEAVFGYNDGVVSTFAVVAGLSAGGVDHKTILLGSLATLFAGAFSMGLGTYLGSKSELDMYESELARENHEVDTIPEIEKQEIRDIYAAKGFKGKLLEDVVVQITGNREVWIQTMMQQELGFAEKPPKPGVNGITMSIAFVIGSTIATFPYFFDDMGTFGNYPLLEGRSISFALAFLLSGLGLFVAGALKTKFTRKNIFLSALETLLVGALAAGASYGIGMLFS